MIKRLLQLLFSGPTAKCQHCGEVVDLEHLVTLNLRLGNMSICSKCATNHYTKYL